MTPYRLGRKHAQEMITSMKEDGLPLNLPVYLAREEIWPKAGPYTWDQYVKGARSILGANNVRYKTRLKTFRVGE